MLKFLSALLLIPALSFAAPKNLAQKSFPGETEVDSKVELAKLFNEEFAREGSPLRKAFADIIKEYSEELGPRIAEASAEDFVLLEAGGSGGLHSAEYLLPIYTGYKSSTSAVAYLRAFTTVSFRDDAGLEIRLVKRVKVTIK